MLVLYGCQKGNGREKGKMEETKMEEPKGRWKKQRVKMEISKSNVLAYPETMRE